MFARGLPLLHAHLPKADANESNHADRETNIALTNFTLATQQLTPNQTAIGGAQKLENVNFTPHHSPLTYSPRHA